MDIWQMKREISEAKQVLRNADDVADSIAEILPGRLRHVSGYTLAKLKKELKDFNAHTGQWRDA